MLSFCVLSDANNERTIAKNKDTKWQSSKTVKRTSKHKKTKSSKSVHISTADIKASQRIEKPIRESKNEKQRSGNSYWEVDISTTQKTLIEAKIKSLPQVRGIHVTSWVAGDDKLRSALIGKISNSVINAVVIAIKEKNGKVYIPGIDKAEKWGSYEGAIKEPEKMVRDFKKAGLYMVARVVCFHDNTIPLKNPAIAVKNPDGSIWKSAKGSTWVDPYDRTVWDYILDVSQTAAELGFDEIQFDYVRYPSEGNVSLCTFSRIHNKENATKNIAAFLDYAKKRLSPYNVKISVDVFGLTTRSDMGIGQDLNLIAKHVDYICPMMYPSHYNLGEYNLNNPDSQPYKVIDRGLRQAFKKTGQNYVKIRPYLQDFSLKYKYGPVELRAQIIAARANMINSWILWNPSVKYSWEALTPQMYKAFIDPLFDDSK